jgi:hypothetical protein
VVSVANAGASTESSALLFANDWTYAVTALGVILLVGVVLAVVRRRRASPSVVADGPSLGADAPRHENNQVLRRERKEELAATAGLLGGLLDQYLRSRYFHLLIVYLDTPSLQRRLSEVADEYAAISFFYFCRLIALLAKCESQGGAIPLLSNQVAQDAAQRLINSFLASIPQGEEQGSVDTFEIEAKFREYQLLGKDDAPASTASSQVGDFVRRIDPSRYVSEGTSGQPAHGVAVKREGTGGQNVEALLAKEFAAYRKWLNLTPPGLVVGAEALAAFYELVSQDLRGASEPGWQMPSSKRLEIPDSSAVEILLDNLTTLAVQEVLSESPLPRPIGMFLRKAPLRKVAQVSQAAPQPPAQLPPEIREQIEKEVEKQVGRQVPRVFQTNIGHASVVQQSPDQ